jgi:antitoxin VapB
MAILIKNAEVEKRARELAALTGQTLTAAIDAAVTARLEAEQAKPRKKRTLEEMIAATMEFRRAIGLADGERLNITKADFDEINEIPGLDDE